MTDELTVDYNKSPRRDFRPKYGEPSERYRYKVIVGTYKSPGQFVQKMNAFGDNGWEIINIHRNGFGAIYEVVLKRYQDVKSEVDVGVQEAAYE
ncbi:hypothetical protein CMI47_20190 [Candidatus Pacearchaeota archaeon]|nr:hypothetical protein [Candidatus Pacearchaeota archaeon]|tara:strand:- start:1330 stop:1611 length:282 start_codon:yes stop_codon:yes gene_type:complete